MPVYLLVTSDEMVAIGRDQDHIDAEVDVAPQHEVRAPGHILQPCDCLRSDCLKI